MIIDTDGGVDDFLALVLASARQRLDVKAITTTGGNVVVGKATGTPRSRSGAFVLKARPR